MNPITEDILIHYGMPRRSGRYPWGSGDDPYQHSVDFLSRVESLRKQGITYKDDNGKIYTGDTAIAKTLGLTTGQFRTEISLAKDERRMLRVAKAKSLKEDGLSDSAIGREMGVNESTVRSWLNEKSEARMNQAKNTAAFIKEQIDKKGMIDVGKGVEQELGISGEKLKEALYILEREGYPVYNGRVEQVTNPGKFTTQKVICPPGTEHKEIYQFDKVHSLNDYQSFDGGDTYKKKFTYPESMDPKRLKVRYAEEGGVDKDGIVELRRGVADLSLDGARYAQVRILVGGTHYIKGMAVYSDDMPDGVDVIFNTNKKKGTPALGPKDDTVLKLIKNDPDNPFGSLIKDADQGGQYWYKDKDGKEKLGLINKRADEGDWTEWADRLPSQFLGKQSRTMAKKQLDLAKADKLDEFDEICSLTNPTVKKHLLQKFADECDSAAVHLQAAALPGQKYHVIIPVNTLKDTEVYAPQYDSGTKLALVRYPHAGTFEIPILTVNNKHAPAKKLIGSDSIDAIGINKKVADRLSGADFDGDTVMCIPTHDKYGKVRITSQPRLKGLEGFDPKLEYGPETYKGRTVKIMKNTGTEMGKISNLITDMTLAGAGPDELARAVRHSMVVIDAEKHKLNYKQSEIDNNIAALRKDYQAHVGEDGKVRYGGASTILSRSKGEVSVPKRQGSPHINIEGDPLYDPSKPKGSLVYKTADDVEYTVKKINKKTGQIELVTKQKKQKSTRMAETDDARTLMSEDKHPMEVLYADYANSMKSLGNKARLEMVSTGKIEYSKTAHDTYRQEVSSLNEKLRIAELNKARERAAQRQANYEVSVKKQSDPDMKPGDIKKVGQQALSKARADVGSVKRSDRNIKITDREWDAIQAGAVSENTLKRILSNTDTTEIRKRATPRATTTLNAAKINRIKSMSNSNYSITDIARQLNLPVSTVSKYLKGEK